MRRFVAAFGFLVVSGCGGNSAVSQSRLLGEEGEETATRTEYADEAARAYAEALADFRDENCESAIPALKSLRRQYAYSRFAALSELREGDCLMIQNKYAEAIQVYRRFVRNRPSHAEMPYAQFRIAQSYFEQIPSDFILSPPAEERDQASTRDALRQLRRFILDYPDDSRVPDAQRMTREVMALLARHELYVAEYNLNRDHPEAAARRIRTMLQSYRGSGLEPQALFLLGKVYLRIEDRDAAIEAFQELVDRYGDSGYAVQAGEYLAELGGPAAEGS